MRTVIIAACLFVGLVPAGRSVQAEISPRQIDASLGNLQDDIIAWRRDIHQHPELGNREFRTSKLIAAHLRKLGLDVKTGIAHTGVTAVLDGGRPGPLIALRADMDALPVTEQTDVPFKSTVTTQYLGKEVGVMHACGHDAHVAILMGVAEALVSLRQELTGSVQFVFQPAEEGAPEGEEGGASLMLKEGLFDETRPEAVFGLHVASGLPSGVIAYRAGPLMAASDPFRLDVIGRGAHGSRPWSGVDPIVVAAQIVMGLQTIVSWQVDIASLPAVVTVGRIEGGVRHNVISDNVELRGTIRTFDPDMREDIIRRMRRTVGRIAESAGAEAALVIDAGSVPVVFNDPALTERVLPSLQRVAGEDRVRVAPLGTGSEDFAFFAEHAPAFYFFVGVTSEGVDMRTAPSNHSALFHIDEPAIQVGARALMSVAVDYLQRASGSSADRAADGRAGR